MVSVEGKTLPLREARVEGEAEGGLARVVLRQTFTNPHPEPLNVTYLFPLPADGAVAGYEFRIGERRVKGQVDRRASAHERYEKALVEGRTAGLLDQERADLFTQSLGNVPPLHEVIVELRIDQRLRWLTEGMWEWRFPTVVTPRYLGGEGRIEDAGRVSVEVAEADTGLRATIDFAIGDSLPEGAHPESPTHAIRTEVSRVTLADAAGAALDRDLVVRWPVARAASGVTLKQARPGEGLPHSGYAYGLLTIVPPEAPDQTLPRDLILLIDTSGSMSGRPLALAKRVAGDLIGSLGAADRLEMIAYASEPRRWRRGAIAATAEVRRQAVAWIEALRAGGGTEMTHAIEAALAPLRPDATRQVVLLTDGQIGFEAEVFRAIRDRLPKGSRLHAVGVGTAVNRGLLAPAARAGRGVEILIDLDEAPERGVARLLAATRNPVLTDVEISGPALTGSAPRRVPDLLAGAPVLAGVRLRAEGGEITVRAHSAAGEWRRSLTVPPTVAGGGNAAITALYGREAVEDLELDRAAGADRSETDRAIERLGLEFGLATRLTSWVAISEEPTVDPRQPIRLSRMPQSLPYGLSAEGLGLRSGLERGMRMRRVASADETLELRRMRLPVHYDAIHSIARFFMRARARRHEPPRPDKPEESMHLSDRLEQDRLTQDLMEPAGGLTLRGRWMTAFDTTVQTLEVEVAGQDALDWRPEGRARLLLTSGESIEVEIDHGVTTVPGRIEPGMAFRIGLRLAADQRARVAIIEIVSAGAVVRVVL